MEQERNRQKEIGDLEDKIDTYSDLLYKLAWVRLKNEQDAQDVVQETFCQYYKSAPRFESREHEKAWFIRVTLNGCRKIWRSAWNRHVVLMPEQEQMDQRETEADYLARERGDQVLQEVLKLSARYREVIHLFYYMQLSVKEIAAVTGSPESTVTSRLTRGREILRKRLKEDMDFE